MLKLASCSGGRRGGAGWCLVLRNKTYFVLESENLIFHVAAYREMSLSEDWSGEMGDIQGEVSFGHSARSSANLVRKQRRLAGVTMS